MFKRLKFLRLFKIKPVRQNLFVGKCYNLKELYNFLNASYFDNKLDLSICWFGSSSFVPMRRLVFGSYNQRKKLIKIHRILDKTQIPADFLSFIIYHEMLHHVFPPIKNRGARRQIHHAEFKAQEKLFPDYARMKMMQKSFLHH